MQDGACPKCGKRELRRQPRSWCDSTTGSGLRLTLFRGTRFRLQVCTACGFVEHAIEDRKALDFIAGRWERVP